MFKTPGGRGGPEEERDVGIVGGGREDIGGVDRDDVGVTARDTIAVVDNDICVGVLDMLAGEEAAIEVGLIGDELNGVRGTTLSTTDLGGTGEEDDKGGEFDVSKGEELVANIGAGEDLTNGAVDVVVRSTEDSVADDVISGGICGDFSKGDDDTAGDAGGGGGEEVFDWSIVFAADGRVDAIILGIVDAVITDVGFICCCGVELCVLIAFIFDVVVEDSGVLGIGVADEVDADEAVTDEAIGVIGNAVTFDDILVKGVGVDVAVKGATGRFVEVVGVVGGGVIVEVAGEGVNDKIAGGDVKDGLAGVGVFDEDVSDGANKDVKGCITEGVADITETAVGLFSSAGSIIISLSSFVSS